MKLIKLSESHYIIVDDSEIKDVKSVIGKWHLEKGNIINQFPNYLTDLSECRIISHSTQPLEDVINLSLSEVEEAINGYSVEKIALKHFLFPNELFNTMKNYSQNDYLLVEQFGEDNTGKYREVLGYIDGFKATMEFTKDKLFTAKDMINAYHWGKQDGEAFQNFADEEDWKEAQEQAKANLDEFIESLEPKTEWDVTFDENGKLKLEK